MNVSIKAEIILDKDIDPPVSDYDRINLLSYIYLKAANFLEEFPDSSIETDSAVRKICLDHNNKYLCKTCSVYKHTGKQLCTFTPIGYPFYRKFEVGTDYNFIPALHEMVSFLVDIRKENYIK